jgi:murein DD-endopeptidase MepM/ murein hydrolase activator NlpD
VSKPAKVTTAKVTTAKAAAAKPAKAAAAKVTTDAEVGAATATAAKAPAVTAPKRRPTPHKRTPDEIVALIAPAPVDAPEPTLLDEHVGGIDLLAEVSEDRPVPFFRRRLAQVRRRPAMLLASAVAGALGVSLLTGEPQQAFAETSSTSHSVSVAEQLGIELEAQPIEEITPQVASERLGELAASRSEREAQQAQAADAQAEAVRAAEAAAAEAARPKAVLPVNGARLTSTFGPRWGSMHSGIDLAAPMMTPEYAAMDGVVLEAGPASGYGNAVYIQHENGDVTVYGHMEQILVSAGQVVKAGDTIALLGNRGQSTGPHLHFEVHVGGIDGQKIDPLPWLRERGVTI